LQAIPGIEWLWFGALFGAGFWLLSRNPWWLVVPIGPFIGWSIVVGNVAALLFALVALALPTRYVGLAIGLAASLKAFPLLLVIPLLRQGRYAQAGLAVLVTVGLAAPMLLFDLSGYTTSPEGPRSLYNLHPALWAAGALVGLGLAVWKGWGGVAVTLASPRFLFYDLGWLLTGEYGERARHRSAAATRFGDREVNHGPVVRSP
jgi:hypothetical protein